MELENKMCEQDLFEIWEKIKIIIEGYIPTRRYAPLAFNLMINF